MSYRHYCIPHCAQGNLIYLPEFPAGWTESLVRVLIVDDHELVRRGVRSVISARPEVEVCGEANNGQDAIEEAMRLAPDVVVMDITMPMLNGLDATREMRRLLPNVAVIILSQHDSKEMMRQAWNAGARGFVTKFAISQDLLTAIDTVSNGEFFFDTPVTGGVDSSLNTQEILERSAAFERELRESEERFRLTFEQAPVGIAHNDQDGRWIRMNQKLCEIVGYPEEELRKLTIRDITHPDDIEEDLAQCRKIQNGEAEQFSMEKRYLCKNGQIVWANLTVSGVRDVAGKLKYFVAIVEDIGARKEAELTLRDNVRRLHDLFMSAPAGMSLLTGPEHRFTFINTESLRTSRRERAEDLLGKPAREAMPELESQGYFEIIDNVYRSGTPWAGYEMPVTLKGANGAEEQAFLNFTLQPVRNAAGEIDGVLYHGVEVTSQVRARRTIEGKEERLRLAQAAAEIGTWEWDPASGTGVLSAEAHRMFGTEVDSMTYEQVWVERLHHEDADRVRELLRLANETGYMDFEYRYVHPQRGERWFHCKGARMREESRMFGVVVDITERKQADHNAELLRQSEQIRELSWKLLKAQEEERRHIARELHDSAGQLVSVLGMKVSSLLRSARQEAPGIAERAQEAEELTQQVIKEIRTASYLLHPPMLDEIGLGPALSGYIQGFAERTGLKVTFRISEDFGRLSQDMELAVYRVVQEGLTNIHRHSGSQTAQIEISRERNAVSLKILDQGSGIGAEKLAQIHLNGTGVGIRGMRERLRQFGGELAIESNSAGTAVRVRIPLSATATSDPSSMSLPSMA
jgi:PAS domain S-box-containing protein